MDPVKPKSIHPVRLLNGEIWPQSLAEENIRYIVGNEIEKLQIIKQQHLLQQGKK